MDDEIQKLATELYHQKSVLIMGRGYHYATCLEGALVSLLTCNFSLLDMRTWHVAIIFKWNEIGGTFENAFVFMCSDLLS